MGGSRNDPEFFVAAKAHSEVCGLFGSVLARLCQGSAGILRLALELEFVPPSPTCSSLPGLSFPAFTARSRIAVFQDLRVCLQAGRTLLSRSPQASNKHPFLSLSQCSVLGEALSVPVADDAKAWFSPFYRRTKGGLRGRGDPPRVTHLMSPEGRFLAQLVHPASKVKVSTAWPGFSTTFGIVHVHDLSGFAFRMARCYLRD